ncbi:MAG: hypothetical protein H6Q65_1746 [Firmicutes bacterium]|nr:hypothetical protein [Bacillota bacterium]
MSDIAILTRTSLQERYDEYGLRFRIEELKLANGEKAVMFQDFDETHYIVYDERFKNMDVMHDDRKGYIFENGEAIDWTDYPHKLKEKEGNE